MTQPTEVKAGRYRVWLAPAVIAAVDKINLATPQRPMHPS